MRSLLVTYPELIRIDPVCRSLERDSKYLWERMQSLKLIRRMMTVDSSLVPRSIVQALVAIAEHAKDDFRRVSLDAVRELGTLFRFNHLAKLT